MAIRRTVAKEEAVSDPFNLQRFVDAQEPVLPQVLAELRAGRKSTHWMWFVFPQLRGLGSSMTAVRYALGSIAEATAYLEHPVLGPRLRECTRLVLAVQAASVDEIFGHPDDRKFWSSVTLFSQATGDNQIFREALERYFGGAFDPGTQQRLAPDAAGG